MLVTVAICTRDRARSLARTLASLAAMAPPGCAWDIVVVDNASSDDTQAVVAGFADRLPLRSVREPRPGVSHARNRAVAVARGRYIAWTDDDVVVDPDWLAAYVRGFARWPEAALFGGPIAPVLLPPAVAWMRDNADLLAHPLGLRAFGPDPLPLSLAADRLPFGGNYAVCAEAQRRFPYDPALGVGPVRRLAEETAVYEAMLAAGCTGWWLPAARVEHIIGPERQTPEFVRRWFAAAGETNAYRYGTEGVRLLGVPRWLWRRLLGEYLRYRLARLTAPPQVWLPRLIALAQAEGAVRYWWRTARAGAATATAHVAPASAAPPPRPR